MNDSIVKLVPYILTRKNKTNFQYALNMIDAKSMWEKSNKGLGVKIAVIDSGCDIFHESLKNNILGVRNFTNEDDKNTVIDRVGHGTHVIGTIVSNKTVCGVAPNAGIYVLKAIDKTGSGKLSWVLNAIYYAIEKEVDIISMSLGMAQNSEKLERAIKCAINKNIIVVCAAGNDGDGNGDSFEYSYPAAYIDVICVGAVDKNKVPATFSSSNPVIDLLAPGVDIISTFPNNKFEILSGTSMATPHVTGALALIKNWAKYEFKRELTQEEIYAQLIKHTENLNYERTIQGNGLLYLKESKSKKITKY